MNAQGNRSLGVDGCCTGIRAEHALGATFLAAAIALVLHPPNFVPPRSVGARVSGRWQCPWYTISCRRCRLEYVSMVKLAECPSRTCCKKRKMLRLYAVACILGTSEACTAPRAKNFGAKRTNAARCTTIMSGLIGFATMSGNDPVQIERFTLQARGRIAPSSGWAEVRNVFFI